MRTRSNKKDIAIIGMSGKFPNSENLNVFWENLALGNDLTRFYSDAELEELGMPKETIRNERFVKCSLHIDEPENFDYSFFGYTREESALMDPQIRLLHEQTWLALENAGYNPMAYNKRIGCFMSASDNMNWRTHAILSRTPNVSSFLTDQISDRAAISRLISYALNLKGPSYFLDTACSSSLVGIHVACRSLMLAECAIAVAGGVSIGSSTNVGYMHEMGMIFSKDGYCRTFDKDASGTLMGEGAGVVVLKRLEDALNDNDHIYGVIRASAVNNDGNQKVGYTAPSVSGQYNCVKLAQKIAGVNPEEISYIEAHGTGTKLGDPIEIEALNKAFENNTSHSCYIGSLKTNIGHLDTAAGVASVIKTVLSLHNKQLLPSLHFKVPNPEIDFKSGPFSVNTTLKNWEVENTRIAGVSSFGIGGTNAHIILEEAPKQLPSDSNQANHLVLWSAKTKTALANYRDVLKTFLVENPSVNLGDLAYTLQTGREFHKYRSFVVGSSVDELIEELNNLNPTNQKEALKGGLVFMFSGQGSQYFQMGADIYEDFTVFREIMDKGFDLLKHKTGKNFKSIIGYDKASNQASDLINETCYTQPILFLLEYAFAKLLFSFGAKPQQMIGHSLGEYVAACLSGVFTFEEGIEIIVKRAELMYNMERGSMINVLYPESEIRNIIGSTELAVAAINTDDSCVISGKENDIEELEQKLADREIEFVRLKTSHAFHSSMMSPMLEDFKLVMQNVVLSEPELPFISCKTGKTITNQDAVSVEYWVQHLRETVYFSKGLDSLMDGNYSTYLEIGAARTLTGFVRQHKSYTSGLKLMSVLRHPKQTKKDSYYLLKALGELTEAGIPIDWEAYYFGQKRNKIPIPGYVFDKIKFPARVNPLQRLISLNGRTEFNEISSGYQEEGQKKMNPSSLANDEGYKQNERPDVSTKYMIPETKVEVDLLELCSAVLGLDQVGIDDDFFELGGDSLKGITLLKRIYRTFNVEIEISVFFEKNTVRKLAEEIELAMSMKEMEKKEEDSSNSNQIRF